MTELEQALVRTLAFFDIFNYPLTMVEIWMWLNTNHTQINTNNSRIDTNNTRINHEYRVSDIDAALSRMTDKVESKNGFYFLKGREAIIEERLRRYGFAEDKFQRAIKFIKIFRFIPFIKTIAICNTLAYSNSAQSGDIDLFVIAKKNRLWLTRFLVVGFLKLLKVRPTEENKEDTIDTTFFLSDEDLNIKELQLQNPDTYLIYWINQVVPIYDINNTYQKFQSANGWIKECLPNTYGYQLNDRRLVSQNWFTKIISWKLKLLLDWQFWENMVKKYQLKVLPRSIKEMMNKDSRVVINDKMLKFHRGDRRAEYQEKYTRTLEHWNT